MKLNQLINIRKIFNEHSQEKLSVPLAYKMMKFIKATEEDNAFYDERIKAIIELYAVKDEKGKPVTEGGGIKIVESSIAQCNKEVMELSDHEVEAPKITFTLSELTELKLSASEMYALDEIIKE